MPFCIGAWLHRRTLLLINILILLFSLGIGACFLRWSLGFADVLNMFSPYPVIDAAHGATRIATGAWGYLQDWYNGMNGRVSQALLGCAISAYSKLFASRPEDFPWWLMRALSLFCIIACPLNFMVPAYSIRRVRPTSVFLLLLAIWGSWTLSHNVVSYSLWFDALLTDRFLMIYIVSVMCLAIYKGWLNNKWYLIVLHGCAYMFLAVEQFLLTIPLLFLAFAWIGADNDKPLLFWIRRISFYLVLSLIAAYVYFHSPGQQWRMSMMTTHPAGAPLQYYVEGFLKWLKRDGYSVLFNGRGALIGLIFNCILYTFVAVTTIAATLSHSIAKRLKFNTLEVLGDLFHSSVLATTFLTAYMTSLSTLLISRNFPEYAIHYPALLLAIGIAYSILTLIQLFDAGTRQALLAALAGEETEETMPNSSLNYRGSIITGIVLTGVLLWVTLPALPKLRSSYQEVKTNNQVRHVVFQHVIDTYQTTGQTHFILTKCPPRSHGGTMEPPWGVEGYFRWRNYGILRVYLDDNYDFPTRPLDKHFVTIDCSSFLPGKAL